MHELTGDRRPSKPFDRMHSTQRISGSPRLFDGDDCYFLRSRHVFVAVLWTKDESSGWGWISPGMETGRVIQRRLPVGSNRR